ncbi:TrmH family RNA methyltransferase [Granulicella sibirica]|uniref:RNA methyltransferase, TrmH family n=1 Tax=Granulicella sibirica TaxID=2479048 RepID=A0A4Q0T0F9_9BACT|nr:RNA methyltransferase [Granulicella sibirica]RXH55289.1 RNA methyltransferase, TrmH family [Granulicella sibirica]
MGERNGMAEMPGFVVTSRANARVKQLRAATAGNTRLSGGLVAIEGETLVGEALRSGLMLKTVFVSERREVPRGLPAGVEVLRCSNEVLQSAVETQSPQGIAALVLPKVWEMADVFKVTEPLLLIAVGLQDPGNLGTLIRSAEAFGAAGVLVATGTVGAWNQKVLRASAGSVFRVPVVQVTEAEVVGLRERGVKLLAAVASGIGALPAATASFKGTCGVMIGNEGAGLGASWVAMADALVTIPCPGAVESLNAAVAGSVLLYEASRQRSAA